MTPEELRVLRYQLPPYGEGAWPSGEMRAFCRFYGINFSDELPGVEHRVGYVDSGPYRLAVHHWRQPDAVANLLIVHGYYDHTGLFDKLVAQGLLHRCNVVIFDLPGHGLSSGEPAVIHDFADYARAINDVLARVWLPELPLWAMGQSTGCSALTEYARRFDWVFDALVLLAPLVRPTGWFGVRVAHRLLGPFVSSVPRKFSTNTSDREFLEFVARDPLQCHKVPLAWITALRNWLADLEHSSLGVGSALVIQGDNDLTVDWPYNLEVIQKLYPQTEVEYLAGAGHQLANELPETIAHYFSVVRQHLARRGIDLSAVTQS